MIKLYSLENKYKEVLPLYNESVNKDIYITNLYNLRGDSIEYSFTVILDNAINNLDFQFTVKNNNSLPDIYAVIQSIQNDFTEVTTIINKNFTIKEFKLYIPYTRTIDVLEGIYNYDLQSNFNGYINTLVRGTYQIGSHSSWRVN